MSDLSPFKGQVATLRHTVHLVLNGIAYFESAIAQNQCPDCTANERTLYELMAEVTTELCGLEVVLNCAEFIQDLEAFYYELQGQPDIPETFEEFVVLGKTEGQAGKRNPTATQPA